MATQSHDNVSGKALLYNSAYASRFVLNRRTTSASQGNPIKLRLSGEKTIGGRKAQKAVAKWFTVLKLCTQPCRSGPKV